MNNPFIGQLDRLVQVFIENKTRDEAGGSAVVKQLIAVPYANLTEMSGDEDPEGKIRHLVSRIYTVRYNALFLQNSTRLVVLDRGVTYNVYHVKELGRNKHLQLLVNLNA